MKISMQGLCYGLALLMSILAGHAHALMLMPSDSDWTSDANSALHADDVEAIVGTSSSLELFYKSNYDDGSEEGGFASAYNTSYSGAPNNALIMYTGGPSIICPECYLLVKDGNQPQYLFDLASWNGTDNLDLQGFYPNRGAISHVAIFGKVMAEVPESSALILMGLGLIGLGLARRRVAH